MKQKNHSVSRLVSRLSIYQNLLLFNLSLLTIKVYPIIKLNNHFGVCGWEHVIICIVIYAQLYFKNKNLHYI